MTYWVAWPELEKCVISSLASGKGAFLLLSCEIHVMSIDNDQFNSETSAKKREFFALFSSNRLIQKGEYYPISSPHNNP